MAIKKPKLIYCDDYGEYSLWDITLGEYNRYIERIDKSRYDLHKEDKAKKLEDEWRSHMIAVPYDEKGYINSEISYLAKAFGLDVESE